MKKIFSKKLIFVSITCLTLIVATTVFAVDNSNPQQGFIHQHNDNPKVLFPADKDTLGVSFKSKDDILKIVNEHQIKGTNSSIKSTNLKTWSNHMSEDDPNNKDINHQIDPNRNVWVVKTDYPNGIQTKAGFYDKATLTTVFDAQTGQLLESKVTGIYKGKN